MAMRDEITRLLVSARTECSRERAQELFKASIQLCQTWEKSERSPEPSIFKAQALRELAFEEDSPFDRVERWNDALRTLQHRWEIAPGGELADAYADLAVDCFQDILSSLALADRNKILRTARDYLTAALSHTTDVEASAALLARKSSVLRHLSLSEFSPDARVNRLDESLGCATLAVERSRQPWTLLELAQSEWALARYERTDELYVSKLRQAEQHFLDKLLETFEPAKFALPRFYRLTFRKLEACESFPRSLAKVSNPRRLLRESYTYAEAGIQLWYNDYPGELVTKHLSEARSLLESAIAAGYANARLIICLAYVRAIMEGPEEGNTVLSAICTERREVSWEQALRVVANSGPSDLLSFGFALGINQSAVWTLLGTFVWRFHQDLELTEILYRTAVRLSPHNPIALTNLARFLIRKKDTASLQEARRLLQTAHQFADRRFCWWRAVQAELDAAQMSPGHKTTPSFRPVKAAPIRPAEFRNLKELRKRFQIVDNLPDAQERGLQLEALIYELARLTFDTAAPPYRIRRTEGGDSQIDGYFEHKGEKYRVECKWLTQPADHNVIIQFFDKLDAAGVSGLLISMEGFTTAAIGRARELRGARVLLLMDGAELRSLMLGHLTFDQAISIKRLYFDQRSEPYHRVVASPDVH
jgi:hypothetical protein